MDSRDALPAQSLSNPATFSPTLRRRRYLIKRNGTFASGGHSPLMRWQSRLQPRAPNTTTAECYQRSGNKCAHNAPGTLADGLGISVDGGRWRTD
ncbi:MAG TPA: hypothetical protein VN939_23095, partial [Chthoniobacterales bacterium]|nr:hypothetical protein [Chthoniobacterales bacterium]